jgi:hypothetical protein
MLGMKITKKVVAMLGECRKNVILQKINGQRLW